MGARRKRPVTVYLDPDSPVLKFLDKLADKSTEAAELIELGFRVRYGAQEAPPSDTVTVTPEKVKVTGRRKGVEHAPPQDREVTVTKDDSPGWDE